MACYIHNTRKKLFKYYLLNYSLIVTIFNFLKTNLIYNVIYDLH